MGAILRPRTLTFCKPCYEKAVPRLGPRLAGPLLASVALLAAAPATAQDAAGARAFVHSLYAAYHGPGPDYLGRLAPQVFAPGLLALIRRAAASTPQGDVGVLDGDPICDCQDSGGLRNVEVTVVGAAGGQARATAHFRISS